MDQLSMCLALFVIIVSVSPVVVSIKLPTDKEQLKPWNQLQTQQNIWQNYWISQQLFDCLQKQPLIDEEYECTAANDEKMPVQPVITLKRLQSSKSKSCGGDENKRDEDENEQAAQALYSAVIKVEGKSDDTVILKTISADDLKSALRTIPQEMKITIIVVGKMQLFNQPKITVKEVVGEKNSDVIIMFHPLLNKKVKSLDSFDKETQDEITVRLLPHFMSTIENSWTRENKKFSKPVFETVHHCDGLMSYPQNLFIQVDENEEATGYAFIGLQKTQEATKTLLFLSIWNNQQAIRAVRQCLFVVEWLFFGKTAPEIVLSWYMQTLAETESWELNVLPHGQHQHPFILELIKNIDIGDAKDKLLGLQHQLLRNALQATKETDLDKAAKEPRDRVLEIYKIFYGMELFEGRGCEVKVVKRLDNEVHLLMFSLSEKQAKLVTVIRVEESIQTREQILKSMKKSKAITEVTGGLDKIKKNYDVYIDRTSEKVSGDDSVMIIRTFTLKSKKVLQKDIIACVGELTPNRNNDFLDFDTAIKKERILMPKVQSFKNRRPADLQIASNTENEPRAKSLPKESKASELEVQSFKNRRPADLQIASNEPRAVSQQMKYLEPVQPAHVSVSIDLNTKKFKSHQVIAANNDRQKKKKKTMLSIFWVQTSRVADAKTTKKCLWDLCVQTH